MQRDFVVRAQEGDLEAFSALTAGRTPRLFSAARLILRDDELAGDAVQDALLQAWVDIRALREPDRFDAWLHRLLVRACYRAAQRRRTREVVELKVSATSNAISGDSQAAVALRDELERGFRKLSPDQRAVLVLRYYLDLSFVECAAALDIPLGTLQSRLNRATQAMRAAVEADARPTRSPVEAAT